MEISLTGNNPGELAGLVNAVKHAYMEEVVNVDTKKRADRHEMLKKLKKKYEDMLKERHETQRKLALTVRCGRPPDGGSYQQYSKDHLAALRRDLLDVQSRNVWRKPS